MVLSIVLDRNESLERAAFDFQAQVRPQRPQKNVYVVSIDDRDYERVFGAESPLDPGKVLELIDAVAKGGPAVIGIDLETPQPAYAGLPDSVRGARIAWARNPSCSGSQESPVGCLPTDLVPGPAGGSGRPRAFAGVAGLAADADGALRRYTRNVRTREGTIPTFGTAALLAFGHLVEVNGGSGDAQRLIDYRGTAPQKVTASWVLANAESEGYQADGLFRGKIVLIGGTHSFSGDWHQTPLGWMPGVEVWAQVLETELAGKGAVPPNAIWLGILQFVLGLGLVLIFDQLRLEYAFYVSIVALPVASWLVSLVAFGSPRFWVYFFPILGLLLVQQLYDVAKQERDHGLTSPDAKPPDGGKAGRKPDGKRVLPGLFWRGMGLKQTREPGSEDPTLGSPEAAVPHGRVEIP
ncbi:MAG: CHASE2 domain-containing protein [Longimicrobiaceae bacterium]